MNNPKLTKLNQLECYQLQLSANWTYVSQMLIDLKHTLSHNTSNIPADVCVKHPILSFDFLDISANKQGTIADFIVPQMKINNRKTKQVETFDEYKKHTIEGLDLTQHKIKTDLAYLVSSMNVTQTINLKPQSQSGTIPLAIQVNVELNLDYLDKNGSDFFNYTLKMIARKQYMSLAQTIYTDFIKANNNLGLTQRKNTSARLIHSYIDGPYSQNITLKNMKFI
ncbi:MAG: hypothetical protein WC758_03720 [Candidatus Woesearchaeota archaeon]|jgi:hypothetical protein